MIKDSTKHFFDICLALLLFSIVQRKYIHLFDDENVALRNTADYEFDWTVKPLQVFGHHYFLLLV